MKYKNCSRFMEFHALSNDERMFAMSYLNKELVYKTDNEYFDRLKSDIKVSHRELNKLVNLFEFQLSLENYSTMYSQTPTIYDEECFKRAKILNLRDKNVG